MMRLELTTFTLATWRSTTELHPRQGGILDSQTVFSQRLFSFFSNESRTGQESPNNNFYGGIFVHVP